MAADFVDTTGDVIILVYEPQANITRFNMFQHFLITECWTVLLLAFKINIFEQTTNFSVPRHQNRPQIKYDRASERVKLVKEQYIAH